MQDPYSGIVRMQAVTHSKQVKDQCAIAGFLNQLVRVGPQKLWRRHYVALGPSENGKGLCLYFYTEGAGGSVFSLLRKTSSASSRDAHQQEEEKNIPLKFKSELELEQGCEVRPLDPADVLGSKENCFMLITSKNQLKFQASNEAERRLWVETLTKEFEKTMELTLIEQKARMLRRGAVLTWYRPTKDGGPISVKVSVDDQGLVHVGDAPPFHLDLIETVLAGNESDELRSLGDSIFHFNCFVVKLKGAVDLLFPGCTSLDFEAPKQSARDDWVSALEARLNVEGIFDNNANPSVTGPIASPPNKASRMPGISDVGDNERAVTFQLDEDRSKAKSPMNTLSIAPGDSSLPMVSKDAMKSRALTLSIGADDDEEEENDAKPAASGVGELFKQKVKLGNDYPYSRCVSFALETAIGGDNASAVLTPPREITPKEIDEVTHYSKLELPLLPGDSQKPATSRKKHRRIVFDMAEYAPDAFRELRNRWEICDLSYYKSLSQLSGDGAVGDGKSGMLFFFTRDRRYVLKTVKTNEMAVLLEKGLLRAYIKHMADNPDSLLCRFFGLYSFKMGKPAREIILVCMQNTFDTRLVLHEKYDLKGSTRSRWCTPRFGSVLKDLNFGNQKLYLDAKDREDFLKQCEKDTALFEQFNVMDYSLLLGIHKPSENPEKVNRNLLLLSMANQLETRMNNPVNWNRTRNPSIASNNANGNGAKGFVSPHPKPTRWQRDFGGVEGQNVETGAPQVYIMQIIDILQAYDVGKKAENFLKSQMTNEVNEISSVNPKTYRARFLAYMQKITVEVPDQNKMIQAQRRALRAKMLSASEQVKANENAGMGRPKPARSLLPAVEEERMAEVAVPVEVPVRKPPPIPERRPSQAQTAKAENSPERRVSTAASMAQPQAAHPLKTSPSLRRESALARDDVEIDLKDEPDLKAEIAAAIAEFEQQKLNAAAAGEDLGGAFTEVLEDGTEIVILEDGGFIQRMTNGIVIRKFPDGSSRQTNPDGSTIDISVEGMMTCRLADGTEIVHVEESEADIVDIQKNPDGSTIEKMKDGSTVQKNPDGSRIEIAMNGDKRTIFPNGTIIEQLSGGATRQFNPDGLTIVGFADGTRVQTDASFPHIVLTIYPDGSQLQEDKQEGIVIRTGVDGVELHEFPDGSTIQKMSDGYQVQTNVDGTKIEILPDGTRFLIDREGHKSPM